ncbi:MAG: TIGR03545 family protein [Planctomycetota bacterium]
MIRWNYVVVRLLIVCAIVMTLAYGLGPVAHYVTIRSLETTVGAKASIGRCEVGLFPPTVHYHDVVVADPRSDKSDRNMWQADQLDLQIDGRALLDRRYVASVARVSGLEIGTGRSESGHLPADPESIRSSSDEPSAANSAIKNFVDSMTGQAMGRVEDFADDLETIKRSGEIRDGWEARYAAMTDRVKQLESRIKKLGELKGLDNPLRDWQQLQATLAEGRAIQRDLAQLRDDLNALPTSLQSDIAKLNDAKRIDLKRLEDALPVDLSLEGDLGTDMLVGLVRERIDQLRGYLDAGRSVAQYTVIAPESIRTSGIDFDLVKDPKPAFAIDKLHLDGFLRHDGKRYQLAGTVSHLSPTPKQLDEPTTAHLELSGPDNIRLEYLCDRRNETPVDRMTLHWPEMVGSSMDVGGSDGSLVIEGGRREIWIQLENRGDQMRGRLVSRQTGATVALKGLDDKAESLAAVQSLQESLSLVDHP